jgi:hypothetical protein
MFSLTFILDKFIKIHVYLWLYEFKYKKRQSTHMEILNELAATRILFVKHRGVTRKNSC